MLSDSCVNVYSLLYFYAYVLYYISEVWELERLQTSEVSFRLTQDYVH